MFSAAGIVGATLGAPLGKALDGQMLLFLFAVLMIVVGARMLQGRGDDGIAGTQCTRQNAPKVMATGGRHRPVFGLFRHRRRVSNRAGPYLLYRHAHP